MDLFGESVSISGDYAVVGVPGHDVWPYINSGSAFVYRRDGENWTEQAMLVADDAGGGDEVEEAFLRRLEEDRTRGFLRAAAWAATQEVAGTRPTLDGSPTSETEVVDAGVPGDPAL